VYCWPVRTGKLRIQNRRSTRLTNAFSKTLQHHAHMVALYTYWYTFVKMHRTLGMTPAMWPA
jgi:hypothetical protein